MENVITVIFWVTLISLSLLLLVALPILTFCVYILFRVETSYRALKYEYAQSSNNLTSRLPGAPPQSAVRSRRKSADNIGPYLPNYVMIDTRTHESVFTRVSPPPVQGHILSSAVFPLSDTPPPSYDLTQDCNKTPLK